MAVYPKTIVPTTIPGLIVWFDAVDPLNNGTQPADGTAISSWVDKSKSGHNASQASGTSQPLYKTNTIGGLPSILFDGVNDCLTLTEFTLPINQTSIVVFTPLLPNNTNCEILATTSNAGGRYQILRYGLNSNVYSLASYNGVAYNRNITFSFGADPRYLILTQAGSAMQYYINEETITSQATNNEAYKFSQIGALDVNFQNCYVGYIGEILIYGHLLTATELTTITNYLVNKWGLKP